MPAVIASPLFLPLVTAGSVGANVAGNILTQRAQSKASKEAAAIQNQAAMEAARRMEAAGIASNAYLAPLAARQRQAALPWEQMGQDALTSLGAMKGFRAPSPLPGPMAPGAGSMMGGMATMVTMQAPTGETKQVPLTDVEKWRQRGAQVVGM